VRVWLDPPTGADSIEALASRFGEFFGGNWQDVMCDADMSFYYHRGWKVYYAVSALVKIPGISTSLLNLYETGSPVGLNYDRKPVLVEVRLESGVK